MYFLNRTPTSIEKQQGAVLVVGLLILLLTTLIAMGAMQNSSMQEKMASNSQQKNRAFQAAASASDSRLNVIMNPANQWMLSDAIQQYLANTSNWPTDTISVGDSDVNTNLELRTEGEITVTCGNSLTAEEGSHVIPCYQFRLDTVAEVAGSNATSRIFQGFHTK